MPVVFFLPPYVCLNGESPSVQSTHDTSNVPFNGSLAELRFIYMVYERGQKHQYRCTAKSLLDGESPSMFRYTANVPFIGSLAELRFI